jgi:hypothetical protein
VADIKPTGCAPWVRIDTGFRRGSITGENEGNEVMTSTQPGLSGESDRGFYSQALRFLLGFELLLQACVFTVLMILQVNPAFAFGVCVILFIACRLAVRVCKSRLQHPIMD